MNAVKTVSHISSLPLITGLKPGVNEKANQAYYSERFLRSKPDRSSLSPA
jgi:hypothetical protein